MVEVRRKGEFGHSKVGSLEELSETDFDSEPGFPPRVPLKAARENQFLLSPKVLSVKQI